MSPEPILCSKLLADLELECSNSSLFWMSAAGFGVIYLFIFGSYFAIDSVATTEMLPNVAFS